MVDKPRTEPPVKHKKQTRSKAKSRQKRQDDVTETEEIGMHGIDIFNNTVNNICVNPTYLSYNYLYFLMQGLIMQVRKRNGAGLTTNPTNYFNKTWSQYKTGFGNIDSDYWIGLENLYNLTNTYEWSLIVRWLLGYVLNNPLTYLTLTYIVNN